MISMERILSMDAPTSSHVNPSFIKALSHLCKGKQPSSYRRGAIAAPAMLLVKKTL